MINRLSHLFGKQIQADNEISTGGLTKPQRHKLSVTLLTSCVFYRRIYVALQVAMSARDGTSDKQQGRPLVHRGSVLPFVATEEIGD